MMIEPLHANITLPTVHRSFWSHDHAGEADFKSRDECLLAVQSINHQVILKISPKPLRVLIIRLFWDEARVACSRLIEEKVDEDPHN